MSTMGIRNALTALLISVAGLAVWLQSSDPSARFVDGAPASVAASAALGWSQAHCAASLELADAAPRLMMDDLLRLSARFDAEHAEHGLEAACQRALAEARTVAKPTSPAATRSAADEIALRQ